MRRAVMATNAKRTERDCRRCDGDARFEPAIDILSPLLSGCVRFALSFAPRFRSDYVFSPSPIRSYLGSSRMMRADASPQLTNIKKTPSSSSSPGGAIVACVIISLHQRGCAHMNHARILYTLIPQHTSRGKTQLPS